MNHLSRIELSRSAFIHNIAALRGALAPGTEIACVVKGNAYGHGLPETVQILEGSVDYFQVDDLLELERLREYSSKPVWVLGYIPKDGLRRALELNAELAIYDYQRPSTLEEAALEIGKPARVHLKVDTFLGRQGLLPEQLPDFLTHLRQFPHIELAGVYSHFANIEDTTDFSHAQKQVDTFASALEMVRAAGYADFKTHLASTAGALVYEAEKSANPVVRIGLGTYGLYPSEDIQEHFSSLNLQPVLRWVSQVAQVKELPAGFPIGYGLTHITEHPTRVAIIPQGYSDGYGRGYSNHGHVLIRGTRCNVLGRVSMNMITVDVTHLPDLQPEEEVVLLGQQGTEKISAEELAQQVSTINYEVVTNISPLLPRVIIS